MSHIFFSKRNAAVGGVNKGIFGSEQSFIGNAISFFLTTIKRLIIIRALFLSLNDQVRRSLTVAKQ